jgi:hypothetical protein
MTMRLLLSVLCTLSLTAQPPQKPGGRDHTPTLSAIASTSRGAASAWALPAIIARSSAYIHKRYLVNEAIPFLIVRDAAFYEAIKDGEAPEVDCAAGTRK